MPDKFAIGTKALLFGGRSDLTRPESSSFLSTFVVGRTQILRYISNREPLGIQHGGPVYSDN